MTDLNKKLNTLKKDIKKARKENRIRFILSLIALIIGLPSFIWLISIDWRLGIITFLLKLADNISEKLK